MGSSFCLHQTIRKVRIIVNKFLGHSKLFLDRNASTILTCIGGAGVVVTAVMAAKATPKAIDILEKAEEQKGEELTKFEKVKFAGPAYIPSIIAGASTLLCIFGANTLNKRQQAALTSAYALLETSYRDYKKKLVDLYGEEADARIKEGIARDAYEENDISVEEGKRLYYDYHSGRYFESTPEKVKAAEYRINRHLVMRDYAYLNEFYEELDIPAIESGWEVGWTPGGNLDRYWQSWIDFNHEKVVMDDGLECTIVVMNQEPYVGFTDYC